MELSWTSLGLSWESLGLSWASLGALLALRGAREALEDPPGVIFDYLCYDFWLLWGQYFDLFLLKLFGPIALLA